MSHPSNIAMALAYHFDTLEEGPGEFGTTAAAAAAAGQVGIQSMRKETHAISLFFHGVSVREFVGRGIELEKCRMGMVQKLEGFLLHVA